MTQTGRAGVGFGQEQAGPITLVSSPTSALASSAGHRRPAWGLATLTRTLSTWREQTVDWLQAGTGTLRPAWGREDIVHEFAACLRQVREPAEVPLALVRLVFQLSGAERVELHRARGGSGRPICWPPAGPGQGWDGAMQAGPGAAGSDLERPGPRLGLTVELGGKVWGTLHLVGGADRGRGRDRGQRWPRRLVRRLMTLGLMAAAAEQALRAGRHAGAATPFDPATGLYNEPFLHALLEHALAQARRRHEPLSVLALSLDPPPAGARKAPPPAPELADVGVQRLARAIVATLRASDLVARLDEGRFVVVLPAAAASDAPLIAEALRRAIAEAGLASGQAGPPTASLGLAGFPDHAQEPSLLLALALAALAQAQDQGGDRIVAAVGEPRGAAPAPAAGRALAHLPGAAPP